MFYSYNGPEGDNQSINQNFTPTIDVENWKFPASYSISYPYQLLFNSIRDADMSDQFVTTFINPKASLYACNTMEELAPQLSAFGPHSHTFYELMFVLDGELYVNIENERHLYSKGSCYILNKNVRHSEEYRTKFRAVFLQLSPDLLASVYADLCLNFFDVEKAAPSSQLMTFLHANLGNAENAEKDYVDFIPNAQNDDLIHAVHSIFDSITTETLSPRVGSSLTVKQMILQLLCFLSDPQHFCTTPIRIGSDAEYSIYTQIIDAMRSNHGRISRSALAEQLSYSGSYLNEISKKYSGLPLFDLSMTFCMKEAARLLTDGNMKINEIQTRLGFSNRTHFYKVFKETYNMTPAEYRRNRPSNR